MRLNPKAARDRIDGVACDADGEGVLKAAVTAAPEKGKANAALIKLLAREWKLPKSRLAVSAGMTDRRKTIFIEGDSKVLQKQLTEWMDRDHG